MAGIIFPKPVDYTDLDHAGIEARLRELFLSGKPTIDLVQAEFTSLLLGVNAHIADRIINIMNRHGRESRWSTATQRRNILAAVKLIGYRPSGASAASVVMTFVLSAPAATDVTILAGTIIRTRDRNSVVRFRTLIDLVIPVGELSGDTTAEHSEAAFDQFASTGRADQEFRLSRSPYVDGSLNGVIQTGAGFWTEVKNFLSSHSTDRHFVTVIDAQDKCLVRFGNGISGAIPQGVVDLPYTIGGGAAGKLPGDALTVLDGVFTDANGTPVTVTCTNAAATSGGEDRESDARIKLNASASLRVPLSTVARTDYEDVATGVPGVARALFLTRVEDPSVGFNEGFLFVIPEGGGAASLSLLKTVARKFGDEVYIADQVLPTRFPKGERPKTVTFQPHIRTAAYRDIAITAKLHRRYGYSGAKVKANVLAALARLFAVMIDVKELDPDTELSGMVPNPMIDFGFYLQDLDSNPTGLLAYTDIHNAVRDAEGVLRLEPGSDGFLVNDLHADVQLERREFPQIGAVNLIDASTGQLL